MKYFRTYNEARTYCANAGLSRTAITRTKVWLGQWGETQVWCVSVSD